MATFVLVHGGWCGGWIWQRVSRRLRPAGHEVYTPTLTGMGERVHLARPEIDLDTHVFDITNMLEAEDLHDVVLAGHSYAGMVITGVAERMAQRIAHLVYLDAFVPQDGDALLDLLAPEARRMTEDLLHNSDDGWRVLWPGDTTTPRPWPPLNPRFTPHPWKTFTQPLALNNAAAGSLPRTYVRCTADKAPGEFLAGSFDESFRRARAAGWRIREVDGFHYEGIAGELGAATLLELFPAA